MKLKIHLLIDAIVFFGFLVVYEQKIASQGIHEWLGLAIFVTLLVHLILHWKWAVNKVVSFFKKMAPMDRINFVVDFLFFIAVITITLTGVLMSKSALPKLGISLPRGGSWKQLHSLSAQVSIYLLALHFALHWAWITTAFKKVVVSPIAGIFRKPATMAIRFFKIEKN
jgi:hypothetical protein